MMATIVTNRLVLRHAHERDRPALIDMHTDPKARAHLGGAKTREQAAAELPTVMRGDKPEHVRDAEVRFPEAVGVIADRTTDAFIGLIGLVRRAADRPGHVRPAGDELELSYILRPACWGQGYAYEATHALLSETAAHTEDEPVLIITQASNVRSIALMHRLGFLERAQFELHNAQQVLAVANLAEFRAV